MKSLWFLLLWAVSGVVSKPSTAEYVITLDQKVNLTLGAPNATYCKLYNNFGAVVYDNRGPCRLISPKVTKELQGKWTAKVGMAGDLIAESQNFFILIRSRPELHTYIHARQTLPFKSVTMSCFFETDEDIQSCRFKSPSGDLLLILPGDQDVKYTFGGKLNSDNRILNCGLDILKVDRDDVGIWRCAVMTKYDIFYGFISLENTTLEKKYRKHDILAPAIVADPVLKPLQQSVSSVMTDEGFTIGCEISAAIENCFLRSPQGVVYTVSPGITTTDYEYVGEGLDAGVCAIRLFKASVNDTGAWNCTVGLQSMSYYSNSERTVSTFVNVQGLNVSVELNSSIVMTLSVANWAREPMQHCRFIREDGFTITSRQGWIPGYIAAIDYVGAICVLTIDIPDILDMETWIAYVKLDGYTHELTKVFNVHDLKFYKPRGGYAVCMDLYIFVHVVLLMTTLSMMLVTILLLLKRYRKKVLRREPLIIMGRIHTEKNIINMPPDHLKAIRQQELKLIEMISAVDTQMLKNKSLL